MTTPLDFNTLRVQALQTGEDLSLTFIGELTAQHIEPLRHHLGRLVRRCTGEVVIDLHPLTFASINGLGLLTWLAQASRREGRNLILLHPSEHLRDILALTRLDRVLSIQSECDRRDLDSVIEPDTELVLA